MYKKVTFEIDLPSLSTSLDSPTSFDSAPSLLEMKKKYNVLYYEISNFFNEK